MEWSAEGVRAAATVVTAAAAVGAFLTAREALDTWRKELSARAHHDAAKKVLACLFELEEAFTAARQPQMNPLEWAGRTPVQGETDTERSTRNTLHALAGRWNKLVDALTKLEAALAEGRALWRNLLQEHANVVRGKVGAFQYNAQLYAAFLQGAIRS